MAIVAIGCNALLGIDDGIYAGPGAADGDTDANTDAGDAPPAVSLATSRKTFRIPRGHETFADVSAIDRGTGGKVSFLVAIEPESMITHREVALDPSTYRVFLHAEADAPAPSSGFVHFRRFVDGNLAGELKVPFRIGASGTLDTAYGKEGVATASIAASPGGFAVTGRTAVLLDGDSDPIPIAFMDEDGRPGEPLTLEDPTRCSVRSTADGLEGQARMVNQCDVVQLSDAGLAAPTKLPDAGAAVGMVRVSRDEQWLVTSWDAGVSVFAPDAALLEFLPSMGASQAIPSDGGAFIIRADNTVIRLRSTTDGGAVADTTFGQPTLGATQVRFGAATPSGELMVTVAGANSDLDPEVLRRFASDGGTDFGFAAGAYRFPDAGLHQVASDEAGRTILLSRSQAEHLVVERLTRAGAPDLAFGDGGLDLGRQCSIYDTRSDEDGMVLVMCVQNLSSLTFVYRIWP